MIEQNGLMVYKKNEKSNFMSVILDGKLEIHSGKNNFLSEVSRWFVLCPDIFESVYKSYINHTRPINEHIVDFSARVVSNCRILRISKNDFYNELNKNDSNCNSPSQNIQNLSENEQIEIEIQ